MPKSEIRLKSENLDHFSPVREKIDPPNFPFKFKACMYG